MDELVIKYYRRLLRAGFEYAGSSAKIGNDESASLMKGRVIRLEIPLMR